MALMRVWVRYMCLCVGVAPVEARSTSGWFRNEEAITLLLSRSLYPQGISEIHLGLLLVYKR